MKIDDFYAGLRDHDEDAFVQFFEFMAPRVCARLECWGFGKQDAETLAIWFVREIARIAPFESTVIRAMGFEAWIETVTRNTFVAYWHEK